MIKTFKSFFAENDAKDYIAPKDGDDEVKDIKPRSKGEVDFKNTHKMTHTKHPVAGDHQFDGSTKEIKEDYFTVQYYNGNKNAVDDKFKNFKTKAEADKYAKKGNSVDRVGGEYKAFKVKGVMESVELEEGRADIKKAFLKGPKATGKDVEKELKKVKKGSKLSIQHSKGLGRSGIGGGDVISVKGDKVTIKPTASNGASVIDVKDITSMTLMKESVEEAVKLKNKDIAYTDLELIAKGKKPGSVKFNNGKMETVDAETAKLIVTTLSKLNPNNKKKAIATLNKDPNGFMKVLDTVHKA